MTVISMPRHFTHVSLQTYVTCVNLGQRACFLLNERALQKINYDAIAVDGDDDTDGDGGDDDDDDNNGDNGDDHDTDGV